MGWRNAGLKACSTQANLRPAPPKPISVKPGLFFFFLFFFWLRLGFAAGFGGFLHVFGATGASFGALLALLRLDLFRAQQLDEDFFRAIATLVALADDAQISALAVAKARRDGIEEPRDRLASHEPRASQAARGEIAALAQSDHVLDVRAHGLGLDGGGFNALFHNDRGHQIAQQGTAVTGVASEFPTCDTMSHKNSKLLAISS